MPDWQTLTNLLASEAKVSSRASGPDVAEAFERKFGRVELIDSVRRALHSDQARPGPAHVEFVKLPVDTVYTTNYDMLIEQACPSAPRAYRTVVDDNQLPFHGGPKLLTIVKMHGDLSHEDQMTITSKDYTSFIADHPLIATHLSALLITRTPLLIGYSNRDPDFLQIQDVVNSRLGRFRRMGYAVNVVLNGQNRAGKPVNNFHSLKISLNQGDDPGEALARFFRLLNGAADELGLERTSQTQPDYFHATDLAENVEATREGVRPEVLGSQSVVCYVSMVPSKTAFQAFHELLAPVIIKYGMNPVRSEDLPTGDNALEAVRSVILISKLCVFLWTRPSGDQLYDFGIARDSRKPLVVLTPEDRQLPDALKEQRVVRFPEGEPGSRTDEFDREVSNALIRGSISEGRRLIQEGSYRAAIVVLSVALESKLAALINVRRRDTNYEKSSRPPTLGQLVELAIAIELIGSSDREKYHSIVVSRNKAVHSNIEPSRREAIVLLNTIEQLQKSGD